MTNREVIEIILKECPYGAEKDPFQVGTEAPEDMNALLPESGTDIFKWGDPSRECTGVVTTIAPTMEVIKKTAEMGYNLIIPHEPTFWTHMDYRYWLKEDPLFKKKAALLDEAGISIWRFHEHMHSHNPDLVFSGMTHQLGWEKYNNPDYRRSRFNTKTHFLSTLWEFPEPGIPFVEIANLLKEKIGLEGIHYVGDKDILVKRASVCAHGFEYEPQQSYIEIMNDENIDLLIPGESDNWTVQYYVRDSAFAGMGKAVLLIGHFNVESLGMKDLAENFFPALFGDRMRFQYIPAGDSYKYL